MLTLYVKGVKKTFCYYRLPINAILTLKPKYGHLLLMTSSKFVHYFQLNETPIEIAFYRSHKNIVKLLLANNCDIRFYNVIIIDIININAPISGENKQRKISNCCSQFNGNGIGEKKSCNLVHLLF